MLAAGCAGTDGTTGAALVATAALPFALLTTGAEAAFSSFASTAGCLWTRRKRSMRRAPSSSSAPWISSARLWNTTLDQLGNSRGEAMGRRRYVPFRPARLDPGKPPAMAAIMSIMRSGFLNASLISSMSSVRGSSARGEAGEWRRMRTFCEEMVYLTNTSFDGRPPRRGRPCSLVLSRGEEHFFKARPGVGGFRGGAIEE